MCSPPAAAENVSTDGRARYRNKNEGEMAGRKAALREITEETDQCINSLKRPWPLSENVKSIWYVLVSSPGASISNPPNIRLFSSLPACILLKLKKDPVGTQNLQNLFF